MKKIVCLLLMFILTVTFAGCTRIQNDTSSIDLSSATETSSEFFTDNNSILQENDEPVDSQETNNSFASEKNDTNNGTKSNTVSNNNANLNVKTNSSVHKHTFSAATCTEPKKCSCGYTEGTPLGHIFENGVCKRCNAKDANRLQYTVIYNSNGGWGTTDSSTHICNEKRSLSRNGFKRAGYTFLGWNTDPNATTAQYSDTQLVENLAENNTQTVTLYAIWKESQTSQFDDCVMTSASSGSAKYHQTATDNLGQTHSDVAIFGSEVGDNWLSEYKTDERFVNGLFSKIQGVAYLKDSEKNDSFTEVKLVIYGDGNIIYKSDSLTQYSGAIPFDVDISGINVIRIQVSRPSKYLNNLGGQILVENLILSR